MRIILTRSGGRTHTLEVFRDGGASEKAVLDTKTYLMHDLLHYAAESLADLPDGFWGTLASGKTLASMNDREKAMADRDFAPAGMGLAEMVTGALTGAAKGEAAPADVVAGVRNMLDAYLRPMPEWMTESYVAAVQERMRRLMGRWNSLESGGSMELAWPAPAEL